MAPITVAVAVAVAGLGWASASAPAVFAGDAGQEDAGAPAWPLILVGGALLGAGMGALLGAAQALALRRLVAHPRRWVAANVLGWAPAMAVIFLWSDHARGRLAPCLRRRARDGHRPGRRALSSAWNHSLVSVPTLAGPSPLNRAVLAILTSRGHRLLGRSMVGLRVRGVRTARYDPVPGDAAADASRLVVFPRRPESKRWWRNLSESAEVGVMLLGRWSWGAASLLQPEDPGYDDAVETYALTLATSARPP